MGEGRGCDYQSTDRGDGRPGALHTASAKKHQDPYVNLGEWYRPRKTPSYRSLAFFSSPCEYYKQIKNPTHAPQGSPMSESTVNSPDLPILNDTAESIAPRYFDRLAGLGFICSFTMQAELKRQHFYTPPRVLSYFFLRAQSHLRSMYWIYTVRF